MAKGLRTVGMIAGGLALAATGIGAFAAAGTALAATAGTVASVASVAATAANIGASLLQRPPPAQGSVTQLIIDPDAPQPYVMGEGLFAGVLRHEATWGPTIKKVPNPYKGQVVVYSGGGPVEGIVPWVDRAPVTIWYDGFLWTRAQTGRCPESSALAPHWAGMPGWGAASKLSGQAAICWSYLFDRDGKRFASGLPQTGAYGRWVKVYDPRRDSTFPGGSGLHRLGDETTYEWSDSPALHAGTYAFGRIQNGKRTIGAGLQVTGIDWQVIAAWANVCEANAWTIFGAVFEPGSRWDNLKEIAAAGGAQPIVSASGRLSFRYSAPAAVLDTIGPEDLAEEPVKVTTMASWSERHNTIVPKYVSPDHDWQLVAGDAVAVDSYIAEDGEPKATEWPFNLVKDGRQAAQLAAYRLVDGRELQPIVVPCGPRLRHARAGEAYRIDLPDYDLVTDAVVLQRQFDPLTMTTILTMIGETPAKHDYALGRVAAPPPTPALGQTAEERDTTAAAVTAVDLPGRGAAQVRTRSVQYPYSSSDEAIAIAAHTVTLDDGAKIALPAGSVTGLMAGTNYALFAARADGEYFAVPSPAEQAMGDPANIFLLPIATSNGGAYPEQEVAPGGYGGGGGYYGGGFYEAPRLEPQ